jgi:hypothetical protein
MSARRTALFRPAAFLLLAAAGLAALVPGLSAGICEESFIRCVYDPDLILYLPIMGSHPLYCGLGYVFCKVYVEPILD